MLPLKAGPRVARGAKRTFALVASQYNAPYVQGLINHAVEELARLDASARVTLHQVPGAYEIPLAAQELLLMPNSEVAVVVALGVILQGGTDHADHVARSVTDALQQIALATRVPIVNQVLTCRTEEQARLRCLERKFNRGIEAARAAVSMAQLLSQIRAG